jgi:periplasmic protein TonB
MLSIAVAAVTTLDGEHRRWRASLASSIVIHLTCLTMVLYFVTGAKPSSIVAPPQNSHGREVGSRAVFLVSSSSIGRGGGGGGNSQPLPIRRAESVGNDPFTLRVANPIGTSGEIREAEPRLPGLLLDAKPLAAGYLEQLGLPGDGVTAGSSMGPGSGSGVGTGTGSGVGSGRGPGLGQGAGGGTGGGVYRPGGAVTAPEIVSQVRPLYTPEALERRIQGSVVLELVVTEAGVPSDILVVRSLDARGLDDEAVKAVERWRFVPGRMSGVPVPVLVRVIVDFSIR